MDPVVNIAIKRDCMISRYWCVTMLSCYQPRWGSSWLSLAYREQLKDKNIVFALALASMSLS